MQQYLRIDLANVGKMSLRQWLYTATANGQFSGPAMYSKMHYQQRSGESIIIATPLGAALRVDASAKAIIRAEFVKTFAPTRATSELLAEASRQVRAYFRRELRAFSLPLEFEGTELECRIWRAVSQLGFGDVVSYAEVARAVGHPGAHRAVAQAMAKTPIDLFIPAHRVIGADGKLRGCDPDSIRARLFTFEQEDGKRFARRR